MAENGPARLSHQAEKFGSRDDIAAFLRTLPVSPGVYRMLGNKDEVLYVGKATRLKNRVASYFSRPRLDPRLASMISQIVRIEITVTRTEAEALLLENQLIKSLKPRYNIQLRDDKSHPYVHLSPGDFPRIAFHRGAKREGRYFGPYPSAGAVRECLDLMHKLFGLRSCRDSVFRNRSRPCLQYQIKRCSAPCVGLIDEREYAESVRLATLFLEGRSGELVDSLVSEMETASAQLAFERAARLRDQVALLKKMQARHYVNAASGDCDVLACRIDKGVACVYLLSFRGGVGIGARAYFPSLPAQADPGEVLSAFVPQYYLDRVAPAEILLGHAVKDADLLSSVFTERAGRRVELKSSVRAERARLLGLADDNAREALSMRLASRSNQRQRLEALASLLGMDEPPVRLECFDISHTLGEATVASCVVFGPEGPLKALYRRYNITGVAAGDDYAAMHQVLERRFRKALEEGGELPDVLLIDGGKGQVAQALAVLAELGVEQQRIIGVAKGPERKPGEETLYLPETGEEIRPGASSPALQLIQQIRDEAHRFAITGHRGRREKARSTSRLEDIPGIGASRRAALLKQFGGWQGVAAAGVEELMQVKGVSRELAERIYGSLRST
ncbi:excinuclease ABC subunit UvrC [Pseudofulvimonas gallinarii]|uniref:UvrABC system protein C n=1 Tax=Pseudofulvimonas gallinarii TaxID=634155 RepID=A0A4R3LLX7_9GAMM|nr:excinuclease ABC subunit UvrC [Pseudofulvimonas gallinarii]TCT01302.1 excinuclease ABC subunit C [Pseudofulvimonas gallinarii]THD15062.1 excinuclease ABC subunit C [Pseudofulvimonas gallinarii]